MKAKLVFVAFIIVLSANISLAQKAEVLTNASVVKLFKAGLDNDIILSKIESSACKFDVSGDALVGMKTNGLPGDIIKAMMNKMDEKKAPAVPAGEIVQVKKTQAQGNNIPEPELINAVYVYNKVLQSVQPLERNTASLKSQTLMLGYGGVNMIYQIPGEKSTVRLAADDGRPFIVNTATGPADIFVLYKVQVKKKTRQAVGAKFTMTGAKGSQGVIAIDVKMIKAGLYELVPSTKLEKGEYFFTIKTATNATTSNADVYAFGID